jgi:hypothetical protein
MKTLSATLAIVALAVWGTACQAGLIIAAGAADDSDGAVICTAAGWNQAEQTMSIEGVQHLGPGHIGRESLDNTAFFTAENELDPTVTLMSSIDNDTTFAWTGYDVNVYMNKTFTVSVPSVSYGDWTVASYDVAATLQLDGRYKASIHYAGSALPIGDTLDFGYKLSFLGSVNYCQEMVPVPEPSMIALALSGLVGLLVVRRKYAR